MYTAGLPMWQRPMNPLPVLGVTATSASLRVGSHGSLSTLEFLAQQNAAEIAEKNCSGF